MIETLTFIAICIIDFLMKSSPAYPAILNSYISMGIMFIIFTRFFLLVVKNKTLEIKKRYGLICFLYIILLINTIMAVLYFSYAISDNNFLRFFIQGFLYVSYIFVVLYVKYKELRMSTMYGNVYKFLVILSGILTACLIAMDFIESTQFFVLHVWTIKIIILLFAGLAVVNSIIEQSKLYWYHKQILFARLIKLADNHIMDKAVIPLKREIENDVILHEVKYVLEMSFIRPMELNKLTKQLYNLMLRKGYSLDVAVGYAGLWSETMIVNLMKRKYDFSYCPVIILRLFRKYDKFQGNKREVLK